MLIRSFSYVVLALGLCMSPLSQAGDMTTRAMAKILIDMDISPSEEDRKALKSITNSLGATDNEQTLATIMLNMDTKIRQRDKPVAMKVMLSPAASTQERSIAKALLRFDGEAGEAVKAGLVDIVK